MTTPKSEPPIPLDEAPGSARKLVMYGSHGPAQIVGRLVEIGDDENGQPMLLIHTTREAIMACSENMLFSDVTVTKHVENVTSGRCEADQKTTSSVGSSELVRRLEAENIMLMNHNGQLNAMLDAWYSAFGTNQLTHALARLEAAEKRASKSSNP